MLNNHFSQASSATQSASARWMRLIAGVALVGYVNGRFIVRNSWGTGWGDKGFAYAADTYAQPAFTEAYGVVV